MPYEEIWAVPAIFLTHGCITLYYCYKNDDLNYGPFNNIFSTKRDARIENEEDAEFMYYIELMPGLQECHSPAEQILKAIGVSGDVTLESSENVFPGDTAPESTENDYTVLGFFSDNDQRCAFHVQAGSPEEAEAIALRRESPEDEGEGELAVVAVVAGNIRIVDTNEYVAYQEISVINDEID